MGLNVDRYVSGQSFFLFCRIPSSSKESANIRSQHSSGVIERKKRIVTPSFKFSLPNDTTSSAFIFEMPCLGKVWANPRGILGVFIRLNLKRGTEVGLKLHKELVCSLCSFIDPISVFLSRDGS